MLAAAALFSTGGAAIKSCGLSSLQVAGFRSFVAASFLLIALPGARRGFTLRSALVGSAYAATLVLFVAGNKLTTAANTIFLQSTAPVYVLLLGPWLLGERIRRVDVAFMLAVAAGLSLFFVGLEAPRVTAPDPARGNLLALASGVTWALTVTGLRWLSASPDKDSGPSAVVLGNVFAFAVCAPWAFPVGPAKPFDLLLIMYLGVFQVGAAYVLVMRAMRGVGAFEASLLLLLEPVLNPIWAWLVHGERPGPWALLGGACVLAATFGKSLWEGRSSLAPNP